MALASTLAKSDAETLIGSWISQASDRLRDRKSSRRAFFRPAALCRGGMDISVMCHEISRDEIALLQSEYPPRMGKATVSLWLGSRVVYLDVEVNRIMELENGWWRSVCSVHAPLLDSVLLNMLTIKSNVEQRIHKRYPFYFGFQVHQCSYDTEDSYSFDPERHDEVGALSLDISHGGMRLICDQNFDVSREILQLRRTNDVDKNVVRGRLVGYQEMPNGQCTVHVKFAASRIELADLVFV